MRFITTEENTFSVPSLGQGEVAVGHAPMATYVGSCVALVFYSPGQRLAGLTHVTGFGERGRAHYPDEALDALLRKLRRVGAEPGDLECYVIGGSDAAGHVLNETLGELETRGIRYELVDVSGRYHRKLILFPEQGTAFLKRKETPVGRSSSSARVSSRAMNPIRDGEDPNRVFCDASQVKATAATRLFRNDEMFRALEGEVLPAFLSGPSGRIFTVWSAGCSSGEEAYSLAMCALAGFRSRELAPKLAVFGTDLNPELIQRARAGRYLYQPGGMAEPYRKMVDAYMRVEGREIVPAPELRKLLRFGVFDIRERPKKHRFDFIICNHVFQYYDEGMQERILGNLAAVLKPRGYFYLEGVPRRVTAARGVDPCPGHRNLYAPKAVSVWGS